MNRSDLAATSGGQYRSTVGIFIDFVGDLEIGMVHQDDVSEFVEARKAAGKKLSTCHADVRRIRALLRWGGCESIPAPREFGLKTPGSRREFLTRSEVDLVLRWADRSTDSAARALIYGYLFTGGRAREVLALSREDVDLEGGWVRFRLALKKGEPRRVPICGRLREVWSEYLESVEGRELFAGLEYVDAYRLWKRATQESGVRPLTLHHARHTAASMWVMAGIDIVTVKNWLGHSNLLVTSEYSKVSPQHGAEAMDRFDRWSRT